MASGFVALITFLGSASMRVFLGHLFDFFTRWHDQKSELARLQLQEQIDAAQHARNIEAMKFQAEFGVKVIEAQSEAQIANFEASAFLEAVRATAIKTGVAWVDAWNQTIRPFLATVAIAVWVASMIKPLGVVLNDWDLALIGAVLGVFVGGRIHAKGG